MVYTINYMLYSVYYMNTLTTIYLLYISRKSGRGCRRVDRVKKSGVSYVTINDGA